MDKKDDDDEEECGSNRGPFNRQQALSIGVFISLKRGNSSVQSYARKRRAALKKGF